MTSSGLDQTTRGPGCNFPLPEDPGDGKNQPTTSPQGPKKPDTQVNLWRNLESNPGDNHQPGSGEKEDEFMK